MMNLGLPELLIFLILFLIPAIFLIWALIDCIKNEKIEGSKKALWIIIILLIPLIGSILYLALGKGKTTA